MTKGRLLGAGCLAAMAACSAPSEPGPIAPLSTEQRDENANSIATLVRRLCVETAMDDDRFAAALRGTGWPSRRTQKADPNEPWDLDVWRLPSVILTRQGRPLGGRMRTCTLAVDDGVAPSEQHLTAALSRIAGGNSPVSDEVGWRWRPSHFQVVHMTLGTGSDEGRNQIVIFVEATQLPFLQAIFGA